jgi:hypothetical protein
LKVYKVISRIDTTDSIHVPEGKVANGDLLPSGANGKLVPVDSTGFIELTDAEATRLMEIGAISPLDLEIAALEEKRDEALRIAKEAEAALVERKKQLQSVIELKRGKGALATEEEKAVEQADPVLAESTRRSGGRK